MAGEGLVSPIVWLVLKVSRTHWDAEHQRWVQTVRPGSYVVIPEYVLVGWLILAIVVVLGALAGVIVFGVEAYRGR